MHDLNDLFYFVQVVEHGGFAPAGRALGEPKSKLSRRIAGMEDALGARLLHRSTRQFSVTELGQSVYTHAKAMLLEAEAAFDVVQRHHAKPRGMVRLACPMALLDQRVGAMLVRFMRRHPDVELSVDPTHRRVDVIADGFDLALRVRPPPLEDSELVLRVLASATQCLVASPKLLAKVGTPRKPGELMGLPSLEMGTPQNQHAWHLVGPGDEQVAIYHAPRLVTRSMLTLRDAAVEGLGIVQLPTLLTDPSVKDGSLVRVLPEWAALPEIVHAVYPSRRGVLPAVQALLDHLSAEFLALGRAL